MVILSFRAVFQRLKSSSQHTGCERKNQAMGRFLRHLFHIFGAIIPIGYLYIVEDRILLCEILLIALGVALSIDIIRIFFLKREEKGFLVKVLGGFMKPSEAWRFSASTYFILASLIVIFYLPKDIAVTSLLFLSFGDPVASFIGSRMGEERLFWGDKSVEGSLAFFAVSFVIGIFILGVIRGLVGALIAMVVEGMPTHFLFGRFYRWLDDNLTVPLVTGFLIQVIFGFIW
ncbi:MAG: diacylglycerol/polyprenol kinase family protein [bacterium]